MCTCACACVCVHVCMCVCMRVCVHVCVGVWVRYGAEKRGREGEEECWEGVVQKGEWFEGV